MKSSYPAAKGFSMAAADKRTVSLPAEQAAYIDRLVAQGVYASASEVEVRKRKTVVRQPTIMLQFRKGM